MQTVMRISTSILVLITLARNAISTSIPWPLIAKQTVCTNLGTWIGKDLPDMEDCVQALDYIANHEVRVYGGHTQYEFLAPGGKRATELFPIVTPRRYGYGECRRNLHRAHIS